MSRLTPARAIQGSHPLYLPKPQDCAAMGFCEHLKVASTITVANCRLKMARQYVHFDEVEDVLSSIDLLALCVPLLQKKPSYWKWAIVSAHSALQGAMVCALQDTSGVSVLDKDSAREMREWYDKRTGEPPNERLADFITLLERCCEMQGQLLTLSQSQVKDIKQLHKHFRNNFAHFVPKGWIIEKAGLPRIICAAVDATEVLMDHRNVIKLSGNGKRRLASGLATVRAGFK
jgi:hypothetical protein